MASFSAELHVAGHVFSVLHCRYGVHQATHQRGRVSTQVRHEPVHLTLSVPDHDALLAWAAEAQKRQAASVVFRDANGGAPFETLGLGAAYCVSYHEEFLAGNAADGAYVCHLVLSDPDGFTIQAGGPATAFVAPAARDHGAPGVAALESMAPAAVVHTGGRGPNGMGDTLGTFSKRPYDPDGCGGPVINLKWSDVLVTEEGIALVIQHTSRFEKDPANNAMIERLRRINSGELTATDWDKRYYTHEIREYERYRQLGVPDGEDPGYEIWNDAHTATLEDYQLADSDAQGRSLIYHPDALL